MTAISEWLDLTLLVIMMVIGVVTLNIFLLEYSTPIIVAHDDKTALETQNEVSTPSVIKTGTDIMMSLAVSSDSMPAPASLKINDSPIIDIDNTFIANKSYMLGVIYKENGAYKLKNYMNKRVNKVEYVTDKVNGDYWHFVFN